MLSQTHSEIAEAPGKTNHANMIPVFRTEIPAAFARAVTMLTSAHISFAIIEANEGERGPPRHIYTVLAADVDADRARAQLKPISVQFKHALAAGGGAHAPGLPAWIPLAGLGALVLIALLALLR